MRRLIYGLVPLVTLLVGILSPATLYAADAKITAEVQWRAGVEAYASGNYREAVAAFEQVVELGYGNAEVYFNLGDAYFKLGQGGSSSRPFVAGELGRAVLNYSRALKLDPAMHDARYNLDLARDYTNDTEALPESFIASMWHSLRDLMTSNSWTIFSVVMLALTLALVLVYLLATRLTLRKVSFFVAIITALLFVLTTALALSQRAAQLDDERAVILCADTTPVHASPDSSSKVVRQPSQGVIVVVERSHGEWTEVEFADGEKGWIRNSVIERI